MSPRLASVTEKQSAGPRRSRRPYAAAMTGTGSWRRRMPTAWASCRAAQRREPPYAARGCRALHEHGRDVETHAAAAHLPMHEHTTRIAQEKADELEPRFDEVTARPDDRKATFTEGDDMLLVRL